MNYSLDDLQYLAETGIDLHAWEKDENLDEAAIKAREDIKKGEAYQKFLEAKKAYRTEKDPAKQAELIRSCIDLLDDVIDEAEGMPADNVPEWLISFVIVNLKAIPEKLFWSIFGIDYTKIPFSTHTTRARFIDELRKMQSELRKELAKAEKAATKNVQNESTENLDESAEFAVLNEGVFDIAKTLASKVKHLFTSGSKPDKKPDEAPEAKVAAMAKFADAPVPTKGEEKDDKKTDPKTDKLLKKAAALRVSTNPSGETKVSPSKFMDNFTEKADVIDELGYIACHFYKSWQSPAHMAFTGTMNPDTALFIGCTKDGNIMVEKSPFGGPIVWAIIKAANDKSIFTDKEIHGYHFIVDDDNHGGLDYRLNFVYDKFESNEDALRYTTDMVSGSDE